MILKELDLDVPSLDNDRGYEFCNEVRSIAAHYYSYLPKKFETDGFWKLLVECVDSEGDSELYLNVKVVKIKFDYEYYQTLDNQKKKIAILDALHRGVMKACKEEGWDHSIFQECFNRVVEDEFDFSWVFKKPKKNKSRKLIATAICSHDIDAFFLTLLVADLNGKEVLEHEVLKEEPNEFIFVHLLGDFKWISNTKIEFYDKSQHCIASVDVKHDN